MEKKPMTQDEMDKIVQERFQAELNKEDFRVAIFGSARTQPDEEIYKQIYDLAFRIGQHKLDVVTGGGPGLMDAANKGHIDSNPDASSDSIGLTIELPWESEANRHLDVKKHFTHFSDRLDHFMVLSDVMVITPGGIGTALELFYTWQLVQVKHINPIPIILIGEQWHALFQWVKDYPLAAGLVSPEDLDPVYVVKNNDEAMNIILQAHRRFLAEGPDYCSNHKKYSLDD